MACANGGSAVNGVRSRLNDSHRRSRSNGHSRHRAGAAAAGTASNGHLSNGHLGNGHVSKEALNGAQAAASGRERRASSSSNDSANARLTERKTPRGNTNKSKKRKSGQKSSAAATTSPSTAAGDHPAAQTSCADCNSDLTDSEVEVCQNCFGVRQRKYVDDECCPYPFHFIKKKYLPLWMHEPEYIMSPRPKKKKDKTDMSDPAQEDVAQDDEVHKNTDSLFSTSSGFTNYRGLLNLALILLLLSSTRLFIENLMKYGVLIEPLETLKKCFSNLDKWPNVKIICWQGVHSAIAFAVEYLHAKGRISETFGVCVNVVSWAIQLMFPAYIVLCEHPSPVFSAITLAIVTVHFLKLTSYAHTNYWCRIHKNDPRNASFRKHSRRQSTSGDNYKSGNTQNGIISLPQTPIVKYPDNINLKDLLYYLMAPTLCYELNFPRSARIRKRFLIKRIIEMVFLLLVIVGLVQQWIVPTINNAIKPLSELDFFKCMERLLKLSIPNHFIWLMFFYAFFHSMLNVLAELLMFGDRDFYQDWWNADTISEFWQSWNIPVHRWATRHLYKPLRKRGYSKLFGSVAVFLLSALFHEYLVSVPLKMFKIWAFTGMLMQVPLAYFTSMYLEGKWGNIVVWLSLILGQPIAILAYVHDYYVTTVASHSGNATLTAGLRSEL